MYKEAFDAQILDLTTKLTEVQNQLQAMKTEEDNKIVFSAYKDSGGHSVTGIIIFDNVVLNVGNAYDPETGVFTCKKAGYYIFFFSGQNGSTQSKHHWYLELHVKKNGATIMQIIDNINQNSKTEDDYQNINSHFVLQLEENDTVTLEAY